MLRILQARWPWRGLNGFHKVFWKNIKAARDTATRCTAVSTQSTVSLATPSSSSGGASLSVSLATGDTAPKWFTVALTGTLFMLWLWGWQDTAGGVRSEEKWPKRKKKKKAKLYWAFSSSCKQHAEMKYIHVLLFDQTIYYSLMSKLDL